MKTIFACSLLALGLGQLAHAESGPADAAERSYPGRGFYGGVDLGRAWLHTNLLGQSFTMSGFSYGIFTGYQLSRFIGAEAAYIRAEGRKSFYGADLSGTANTAQVFAVGSLPIASVSGNNFGLQAKVGAVKWWATLDASYAGRSASADDNGTNFAYGGGLYVNNHGDAVRLEYTQARIQGVRVSRLAASFYWTF